MIEATALSDTVELASARERLDEIVERVSRDGDRVQINANGMRAAAIVSGDDLDRLRQLDARREAQKQAFSEFSQAFADVPLEELEAKVAEAVTEARAQLRAERALVEQALAARR